MSSERAGRFGHVSSGWSGLHGGKQGVVRGEWGEWGIAGLLETQQSRQTTALNEARDRRPHPMGNPPIFRPWSRIRARISGRFPAAGVRRCGVCDAAWGR